MEVQNEKCIPKTYFNGNIRDEKYILFEYLFIYLFS